MIIYSLKRAGGGVCPLFADQNLPPDGSGEYYARVGKDCLAPGTVTALGNFDGVHVGHAELIRRAVSAAGRRGLIPVVWTFKALPGKDTLTSPEDRLARFAELGAEYAVLEDFGAVKDMPPEVFARDVLGGTLSCKTAVCGFNYRFGRGAEGTPETLGRLMETLGGNVDLVPPVSLGGEPVSSTRIRAALSAGQPEKAAALLGYPFSEAMTVENGSRIGRKLGIPTINQSFPAGRLVPKRGVYAGLCSPEPGTLAACVINVGCRPTVSDDGRVVCETHILGWEGDLYGRAVRVYFMRYLRPERKFADIGELKSQIALDKAETARLRDSGALPDPTDSGVGRFGGWKPITDFPAPAGGTEALAGLRR